MSNYDQLVIARDFRIRRTELTCPAHSLKMMTKAAGSEADEVIPARAERARVTIFWSSSPSRSSAPAANACFSKANGSSRN